MPDEPVNPLVPREPTSAPLQPRSVRSPQINTAVGLLLAWLVVMLPDVSEGQESGHLLGSAGSTCSPWGEQGGLRRCDCQDGERDREGCSFGSCAGWFAGFLGSGSSAWRF